MKTTTASMFLLFIIFSVTLSSFLFGVASATNEPVLDIDGNEVQTGTPYYVVSSIWGGGGGGLALGRPSRNPCPEVVTQRKSSVDNGIPVIFSNSDSNDRVVRLSSDINIEFIRLRPNICRTTTVWKVDDYDHSAGKWWVVTNGVKGNPGANTLTSWFRIETERSPFYTFKYCPAVCGTCPALCNEIGKYTDGEMVRFALSTSPGWSFYFKKVKKSATEIQQVVHI
ncbi:hypothetical protein E1A91_A10G237500v1 [Gossypium mustelinum]|uniref:21 kDa seed protein n=1 Tax=Gossypium mustelinum TaxID=34275 RepID=A0A5D2XQQ1_GOSMU|nr:hypothetical protein E1A91_A10G237500v1 [Gossypium mustelinum]